MKKHDLVGIDIGGTKCAVVLGNKNGEIQDRIAFDTASDKGPLFVIKRILYSLDIILERHQKSYIDICGIGISCGGPLDSKKGVILSPPNLPGWDEIAIVDLIQQHTGIQTHLQNDANACAVAEWKFGAGKGCNNLIFLTFGTGMGAGLILDGRLYTGINDMAGEVGHIRLTQNGPIGYGKMGSFEGYCSGGGIARLAQSEIALRVSRGEKPELLKTIPDVNHITARDIGNAAARSDSLAIEILHTSGRYLGMGLSILIDILNPERIIIGSIYARCREFLQPAAEEIIRKEALSISYKNCEIVPAKLGEQIGDYACLSVALGI